MNEYESQVKEFHRAMEMDINSPYSADLLKLRQKLLNEELAELNIALDSLLSELQTSGSTRQDTRARMFKELADLQYVLSGMVVALGIPMQETFRRVHQSNMSKLVDGHALKREDGKVLKGPNYKPPFLDDLAA